MKIRLVAIGSLGLAALLVMSTGVVSATAATASGYTALCDKEVNHSPSTAAYTAPFQNTAGWCLMQQYGKVYGGYTGPIDGAMGTNSWIGLQKALAKRNGYSGSIDGKPGTLTYQALQRLARDSGDYKGPIDGVMGDSSWKNANYAAKITSGASD